jgi:hemerythrin-like domain-containing protein
MNSPEQVPLRNALYVIRHEHRIVEQAIRALDGICLRLKWGDQVPPQALESLLDFISGFVNEIHHGREEKYLIPMLEQQDAVKGGFALAAIVDEHSREADLTNELVFAFKRYLRGDSDARELFVEAAHNFRSHLFGHMYREDSLLLPIADDVLSDEDKQELTLKFAEAEREFGEARYKKYIDTARELENAWAI